MTARQARETIKDFQEALKSLVDATLVLESGDERYETALKRQAALEAAIAKQQETARQVAALYAKQSKEIQEAFEAKEKELSAAIEVKTALLADVTKKGQEAAGNAERALKQVTAKEIGERRKEIASLDEEIASKQKRLEQLTAAIDAARQRFA